MEQGAAPQPQGQALSQWVFRPVVAWPYLVVSTALSVTPLWPVALLLALFAAVLSYRERRALGFPAIWWAIAIFVLGPFAFLVFVYKRSRPAVAYPPSVPPGTPAA